MKPASISRKPIYIKSAYIKSIYIKSLLLSLLLSSILQLLTNMHWLTFIGSNVLLFLAIIFIYLQQYRKLIIYIWEMSFAFLGLFIGFYLDFGISNIHLFYELCGQGNMAAIAPATINGMFVGCNLGMLISKKLNIKIPHLLSLNLGMLMGMLMFDSFHSRVDVFNAPLSMFIHLAVMIFFGHVFYSFSKSINYSKIKCQCCSFFGVMGVDK